MRPIGTIRLRRPLTARWNLWALRFHARFDRQARARHLAMLLHARHAWSSVVLQIRLFQSVVQVEPRISLSFELAKASAPVSNVTQEFSHPVRLLMQTRFAPTPSRVERMVLRDTIVASRIERRVTVNRVAEGARREVTHLLERRTTELHRAGQRTIGILMQRTERVTPSRFSPKAQTFRRDPTAAVPSAIKAVAERVMELERQRPALERALKPIAPAINVDQLVDQVIQQIDRRVIARRERLGRI